MDLVLPLKKKWFNQIKAGIKTEEYRLVTPYWRKRLVNRQYNNIVLTAGYPKKNDNDRRIVRPWRGCYMTDVRHEEWGNERKMVFAIRLT